MAVEAIDEAVGRVVAALRKVGGEVFITADHGNAEQMSDPSTGQSHTAHTTNPVPFLYVGRPATLKQKGDLADVSPTLLSALGLSIPQEMTGESLLQLAD
jgi:2,3-bisphosphoglycerate-independent phosphoglycerate mutase